MSEHGAIHRYSLLVEKIGKGKYPPLKELHDHLHGHGFEISERTLQRDIEHIRDEFGMEIAWDRHKNGYYIDERHSINVDSFLRFLELISTADLLAECLRDSKDALKYIDFESRGNLSGLEHLRSLLFAVKNRRIISFTHENYETGRKNRYTLKPLLIKEYQNRWYVFGIPAGTKTFRTFGIDRIENLEVGTETFKTDDAQNPSGMFENIIGLNYSEGDLQEVILWFTPLQGKYVRSLPLHPSQEVMEDNAKGLTIRLHIIPNLELMQKILMLADAVKVLEPRWLAKEVVGTLERAWKLYQKYR